MNDMPMPQDNSEDADTSIMVSAKTLGPTGAALKVGDEVKMQVTGVQGDMLTLAPATDDADEGAEDSDPSTMPLDKLEASLPKAER